MKVMVKTIACEVYKRVTGFYRPVSSMNAGKQEEASERRMMKIPTTKHLL